MQGKQEKGSDEENRCCFPNKNMLAQQCTFCSQELTGLMKCYSARELISRKAKRGVMLEIKELYRGCAVVEGWQ